MIIWGSILEINQYVDVKFIRLVGEVEKAKEMEGITVFETKNIQTGKKRKREEKGDPSDIDGYKGPWRGYVDQVTVSKPTDEEKAAIELMFASKKKEKKEEEQTIEESSLLHSKWYMHACVCA